MPLNGTQRPHLAQLQLAGSSAGVYIPLLEGVEIAPGEVHGSVVVGVAVVALGRTNLIDRSFAQAHHMAQAAMNSAIIVLCLFHDNHAIGACTGRRAPLIWALLPALVGQTDARVQTRVAESHAGN